jgi:TetR/AcrR family transcriptional regulator, regulator of autoinduction and epiphytic fitness
MLDAAESLFRERGFHGTTMDAVAKLAGVAVQTVYFTFHTKALLLLDVLVRMAHGPQVTGVADKPTPAYVHLIAGERDPQRFLALAIEHGHDFQLRVAPIWPYVQAAAETDPTFAAKLQLIVDERKTGMTRMFAGLEARGALRVPAERAASTFFLLQNIEQILLATHSLGWTLERHKAWTFEVMVRMTLKEAAPRADAVRGLSFASLLGAQDG